MSNYTELYYFVRVLKNSTVFLPQEILAGVTAGLFVHNGYAQLTSFTFSLSPPRIFECFLYADIITSAPCNENSSVLQVIKIVVSFPNLILLVRIREMLAFVSDFAYYNYHRRVYGPKFTAFYRLMWNIINTKWIPYSLQDIYSKVTDAFTNVTASG